MLTLRSFLDGKRLSELQEIHAFWAGAGAAAPADRAAVLEELAAFLRDHARLASRLKLLGEKPLLVLHLLARAEGYTADLPGIITAANGATVEGYEVEAAVRALGRRGFIETSRDRTWAGQGREVYTLPRELAEALAVILMEDGRGPRQVFTLAGHVAALTPARRRRLVAARGGGAPGDEPATVTATLLGEGVGEQALASARSDEVRALLLRAVVECGGVIPRDRYKRDLGAPLRWQRKRWQRFLEEAGLGTVTTLGLADCGIALDGETTVVFAEVVERVFAGLEVDAAGIDRTAAARVDLLTDLSHFLRFAAAHPIRVTHGRAIHRAAYGRILEGVTFREDGLVDRAEVLQVIQSLCSGLGLTETGEDRLLVLTRRGLAWDRTPLHRKVRRVYEHFLDERGAENRDFHGRPLRRLLAARLSTLPVGQWIRLRALPFQARNEYLASLEDEGVRAAYRNRFQYAFEAPREDPRDLVEGLVDWTVERLYLLGVVDIGFQRGEPVALRVTDLGHRLLAGGAPDRAVANGDGVEAATADLHRPLVVNPDFEVLLLPEGDVNEVAHALDRFAVRVRSDEVTRYRLQRDAVERAVVQGMAPADMLTFLEERSRNPLPQNVVYSLREWGARVRFARQREAILLEVDSEDALDRALTLEAVRGLLLERLGPRVAALRAPIVDWKTQEALRSLGVYLRT